MSTETCPACGSLAFRVRDDLARVCEPCKHVWTLADLKWAQAITKGHKAGDKWRNRGCPVKGCTKDRGHGGPHE